MTARTQLMRACCEQARKYDKSEPRTKPDEVGRSKRSAASAPRPDTNIESLTTWFTEKERTH